MGNYPVHLYLTLYSYNKELLKFIYLVYGGYLYSDKWLLRNFSNIKQLFYDIKPYLLFSKEEVHITLEKIKLFKQLKSNGIKIIQLAKRLNDINNRFRGLIEYNFTKKTLTLFYVVT